MLAIREINVADAEAAAKLSDELGYPVSTEAMECRIRAREGLRDHTVLVACVAGEVVAWVDVVVVHHLAVEPYGEIGGLVVGDGHRSAGIGRTLLAHAEQWIASQGIRNAVVRSQIKREDAHRFYLREGYSRTKTSAVFSKELTPARPAPATHSGPDPDP
jgi:GNAT superfamily N-acetyltransferase